MADDSRQPGKVGAYMGSTKNIAGSVLAGGGLVLAITGVLAFPIWLPVVAALYGIGALVAPSGRAKDLVSGGFDPDQVVDSLAQLQKDMRGQVPRDIDEKVTRITLAIQSILPKARRMSGGSQHLFILQRTATDYLPTTVHAYLDLPRDYAETRPIDGAGGKTAHQLVSEQLDILASQMAEVVDAANKGDVDSLLAQGRFLDEKFGKEALTIEGPAQSGGTPQPARPDQPMQSAPPPANEQRRKQPPISQL